MYHLGLLYDVDNQRIGKKIDTSASLSTGGVVTERYVIDRNQIILVFDGQGVQKARYLYGTKVDQVLAEESGAGVRWFLADEQGTIKDVVDNTGTVIDHITYDSFGRIVGQTSAIDLRFAYTGREWDAETGQYYNRARYYDPTVGGFINEDPLGFGAGDTNLRRYVGNSPTNYTDPSGLITCGTISSGLDNPSSVVWEGLAALTLAYWKAAGDGFNSLSAPINYLGNKLFTPNNPEKPPKPLPFPNPDQNRLHLGKPETFPSQPGDNSSNPPGFNLDPIRSPFREGFGTDRPNLSSPFFEAQRGRGNVGDTGIRQEAQQRVDNGEFSTNEEALKQLMKEAKNINDGRPDKELVNRIKSEQKAQGDRHSRESKDKKN
jgi:RHS repeat-associated protein